LLKRDPESNDISYLVLLSWLQSYFINSFYFVSNLTKQLSPSISRIIPSLSKIELIGKSKYANEVMKNSLEKFRFPYLIEYETVQQQ